MEALDTSDQVQAAKNIRKTLKGAVTKLANQLKRDLVLEPGQKYDFKKLDKFSIAADAVKLETKLKELNEQNDAYSTLCKDVLVKNKASEDTLLKLEEDIDEYWYQAKKEPSLMLNLYKYEYTVALNTYLKTIEEDNKPVLNTELSNSDKQKMKKKADGEITRQLNRWSLLKTEWECLLSQAETDIEGTKHLSTEELLKQTVLLDADQQIKLIAEQWASLKDFQDTLYEVFQTGGIEPLEAAKKMEFDATSHVKRMQVVKAELGRLAAASKQQDFKRRNSTTSSTEVSSVPHAATTALKMDKIQTPKFSGKPEDFANWKDRFTSLVPKGRDKAETSVLLEQAIPESKRYLLRGCGEDYELMLEILQKELAPTRDVVNSVNLQLSKLKRISVDDKESDRRFVQLVEALEKMERDLTAINRISALANCNTIQEIEGKLPHLVKTDWYKRKREKCLDEKTDLEKFNDMMLFLKDFKYIAKDGVAEYERAKASNAKSYTALVTGQCLAISSKVAQSGKKSAISKSNSSGGANANATLFCLACQDGATDVNIAKHETSNCDHWYSLAFPDRKKLVKCEFHPRTTTHVTSQCKFKKPRLPCKHCKASDHHSLFCPIHKAIVNLATSGTVYVTELPSAATGLRAQVLLPFVYTNVCKVNSLSKEVFSRLGTLTDNCATDIWITFEAAGKLGLQGEDITISAGGFGGKRDLIKSKLYSIKIKTKNGYEVLECLGIDKIGSDETPPIKEHYSALCQKFRVKEKDVRRPVKVDLLIGQRANHLHPEAVLRTIDGMKLLEGPLGKTFAGADRSGTLGGSQVASSFFISAAVCQDTVITVKQDQIKSDLSSVDSSSLVADAEASFLTSSLLCKASQDFLNYFKQENVGTDCTPKCGNCACGQCAIGGKIMSIKEEREYQIIKNNLEYDSIGTLTDPGPYWRSVLPWEVDRNTLGDNKSVVLGTLHATLKKLQRDPMWRKVYEDQLRVLIDNGYARKVEQHELDEWISKGGKTYYISHQVVLVPDNKTTPVRVVFNSSQKFMGKSLNSSLALGPEILNNLQGILLRFRENKVAAAGDIRKMFYCIRVAKEDQMCQLWCHCFEGSDKIETFCMTRLVMGNKPSTSISGVAIKETTMLEDFMTRYPVARQALDRDSYVDNTNTGADTHEQILKNIEEIEFVAKKGGFHYKPWIISGTKCPDQLLGPRIEGDVVEKNLGVLWIVGADHLQVKPDLCYGGNKRKGVSVSLLPVLGDIGKAIQLKLKLSDCLSVHARCFDPLGLVLPVKMTGNLLFRDTLQALRVGISSKTIPWDAVILSPLLDHWLRYFSMLKGLESVTFHRSVKPDLADPNVPPDLITFSDGNESAYGTVAYVLWTLLDGTKKANMFISKAKLGPLCHKGEVVKNELSGVTFASRLKLFIQQESCYEFGRYLHFLDSQIVQYMIRKDSYGFNTFAGLRVTEIQKKTDVMSWHHIPSEENISDILTKGTDPSKIGIDSIWQNGPQWLVLDRRHWPITEPMLSKEDHQVVSKFVSKSKLGPITMSLNASSKLTGGHESIFKTLIEKSSSLDYIQRVAALTLRAIKKFKSVLKRKIPSENSSCWISNNLPHGGRDNQVVMKTIQTSVGVRRIAVVTNSEMQDAFTLLVAMEQLKEENLVKTKKHMMLKKIDRYLSDESKVTQLVLGSRVQLFPIGFTGDRSIPYLPQGRLAELVARKYHCKFHVDIDTTVCHIRNFVFVPQLRRIVSQIDRNCIFCKLKRRKFEGQIMGDLPDFRSVMSPPFSCVLLDLFGPFLIKDDCIKKGPRVHKKVWGVIFSCSSTRAVHLDVAVNYDTDSVLQCIRRLQALRGNINIIISDPGSQLVGACKELKEWRKGWSEAELTQFGAKHGIDWRFIMASSQHQNGAAEVMVKLVKGVIKSLMHEIGAHILSLNELNTVLLETASLVNSRPIGIKPNKDSDVEFLSPNSLLLGRNSDRCSAGPFMPKHELVPSQQNDQDRFQLVQSIVSQFWKVWMRNYFPTLLVRKKWHQKHRNLEVGDICLLQEANAMRGDFRRCRVSQVFPDRHKVVRNVEVLATQRQDGTTSYHPQNLSRLRRHVKNLIVILPVEKSSDVDLSKGNDDTKISSDFRNLELEAPSDECQQLELGPEYSSLETNPGGACQVPCVVDTNLMEEAHYLVNLGKSEKSRNVLENRSQEDVEHGELLAGNVKLVSACEPLTGQASALTANELQFKLPERAICESTRIKLEKLQ